VLRPHPPIRFLEAGEKPPLSLRGGVDTPPYVAPPLSFFLGPPCFFAAAPKTPCVEICGDPFARRGLLYGSWANPVFYFFSQKAAFSCVVGPPGSPRPKGAPGPPGFGEPPPPEKAPSPRGLFFGALPGPFFPGLPFFWRQASFARKFLASISPQEVFSIPCLF